MNMIWTARNKDKQETLLGPSPDETVKAVLNEFISLIKKTWGVEGPFDEVRKKFCLFCAGCGPGRTGSDPAV